MGSACTASGRCGLAARAVASTLVLMVGLSSPRTARAITYVYFSQEALALHSDLVAEVYIESAGEPTRMQTPTAGMFKDVGWHCRFRVQIVERIVERVTAPGQRSPDRTSIQTPCNDPVNPRTRDAWGDRLVFAELAVGARYVVMLDRTKRGDYVLPCGDARRWALAGTKAARLIRWAARTDRWPWGAAVNDLQVAFLPRAPVIPLPTKKTNGSRFKRPASDGRPAEVDAVVAVRNVSERPIALNVRRADRFLSLSGRRADGAVATAKPHWVHPDVEEEPFGRRTWRRLDPGEIVLLTGHGTSYGPARFYIQLSPGTWSFAATYSSSRKADVPIAKGKPAQKVWMGTASSQTAILDVRVP